MKSTLLPLLLLFFILGACNQTPQKNQESLSVNPKISNAAKIAPLVVTEPAAHDTDDPAIWINPQDPAKSLIIGTDKNQEGALYVYDLEGKIIKEKVVTGLKRPNNVDIAYGFKLRGQLIDFAVTTERLTNKIRIYRLPEMQPIDNGGIDVFAGEKQRAPMGISLYKRPSDGNIYAIVGRKDGPRNGTYLWQYLLEEDKSGNIKGRKVREFGKYSGNKEIESIAVDAELGYVYYSDETIGVRKYYADPDSANVELALFATSGFTEDHEGVSIYTKKDKTGYIIVSDQQANKFHIFTREGTKNNPHDHRLVKVIDVSTISSDGSEVTSVALNEKFPKGLFVAMSDDKTFQYYSWQDIIEK
ncbi:3-phytase [Adhaeribacter aerolatus]|uniref:3-phytase n=1 Tax=Adhaeribacter aerolatus TaxID=670289 RepID=A0A512AUM9_9BACT|nr:phytase [Adhaeribacter aerolatus]GEO03414.1 3-phytase [Adhaeribacter aerolatus]